MRLVAQDMPEWECRSHFYGVAAHLMRQILVDHARRHRSQKRGGGISPVPLDEVLAFAPGKSDDVLALDEALNASPSSTTQVPRHRAALFGGLSVDETARALNVSVGTIDVNSGWPKRGCIAPCAAIAMNAERWQAIGDLFEQALPMPAGDRTALLDGACGVDENCDGRSYHCWRATTPAAVSCNTGSRTR